MLDSLGDDFVKVDGLSHLFQAGTRSTTACAHLMCWLARDTRVGVRIRRCGGIALTLFVVCARVCIAPCDAFSAEVDS